jgi:hypothetical protein
VDARPTQRQTATMRRALQNIALVVVSTVFAAGALAAVEFSLRQADPAPDELDRFRTERVIRLRELRPNFDRKLVPAAAIPRRDMAEGLNMDRGYRLRTDGDGFILPGNRLPGAKLRLLFLGGQRRNVPTWKRKNGFLA